MNKNTIKYNPQYKKDIASKWSVSVRFVGQCLNRDRDSPTAEQIRNDYHRYASDMEEIKKLKLTPKSNY